MVELKQVRLINWYGFSQITVPVGFFTLIAGKNGNGKSVFLDAIKYALYGDTVFNKSTENKGSRTVPSYTRGLLDATAGTYMRPADKMPNVYTHIVLEMEDAKLLEYAAYAECSSSHPISKSLQKAYGKPIDRSRVTDIEEIGGNGVIAKVDGVSVAAGCWYI